MGKGLIHFLMSNGSCLWKAARALYCKLPYVECMRAPSVKTCWDLWKEAMSGNVAAIRQFIVAIMFVPLEFVKDLFDNLICSVGVCKTETLPPPKEEDLYSWIWNHLMEYGSAMLLSSAALGEHTLKTFVFGPVIWLCGRSFFQAFALVIILSLAILKVFKVIKRRRSSNRTEIGAPPFDMNMNIIPNQMRQNPIEVQPLSPRAMHWNTNPDHVTQNPNEIQPAQ